MSDGSDARLRVFLIRGLAGGRPFCFSGGLDVLAQKLKARGIWASVHEQCSLLRPYGAVDALTITALRSARDGARPILIGHSMGADVALKVATGLAASAVPVPLVVCFDPTSFRLLLGPPPVPRNVARALCFYQKISPLGRGILTPGVGFTGALIQERVSLIHSSVDDDPALQSRVLAEIETARQA